MEVLSTAIIINTTTATTFNQPRNESGAVPENCVIVTVKPEFTPWQNPHNLINNQATQIWASVIHAVFLPILFLIGFPTNALNMLVFYKQGLHERINLCLFFLSLADFVYIAQAFCLYADRIYLEVTQQSIIGSLMRFMMNNNIIGLYGFSTASSWMTTIIACERCFCVLSPLRSQTVLKTKTMLGIIMISFIVLVGGYFIVSSKWNIICVFYVEDNYTDLIPYPSDFFRRNKDLVDKTEAVVYGLTFPLFCITTVTIATIVTIVKLRSIAEWREKSSSAATSVLSRDVVLTRMLIGISILFIVSFIPGVVLRVSMLFIQELNVGGYLYNTYRFLTLTVCFFTYINSSFNFFIYYSFGSKYRATLTALLCRKVPLARKAAVKEN